MTMRKALVVAAGLLVTAGEAWAQGRGAGGGAVASGGVALTDYVLEILGTIAALFIIYLACTAASGAARAGGIIFGLLCLMVALNPYDVVGLIPGGGLR